MRREKDTVLPDVHINWSVPQTAKVDTFFHPSALCPGAGFCICYNNGVELHHSVCSGAIRRSLFWLTVGF